MTDRTRKPMAPASLLRMYVITVVVTCAFAGCGDIPVAPAPPPAQPPVVTSPPPPTPPPHVPSWPGVLEPARIYEATFRYSVSGDATRYVLYDRGRFSLQFSRPDLPFFEYPGTYTEEGGRVTFHFEWNAGASVAVADIDEESLDVWYNGYMQLSDFENGKYARVR